MTYIVYFLLLESDAKCDSDLFHISYLFQFRTTTYIFPFRALGWHRLFSFSGIFDWVYKLVFPLRVEGKVHMSMSPLTLLMIYPPLGSRLSWLYKLIDFFPLLIQTTTILIPIAKLRVVLFQLFAPSQRVIKWGKVY